MCMRNFPLGTAVAVFWVALSSCQSDSGTFSSSVSVNNEDTSVSGTAAAAVGGALSGSINGGMLAQSNLNSLMRLLNFVPEVNASASSCPTYHTASGPFCTANNSTMWLTYSDCSFGDSAATWLGTQALTFGVGADPFTATCGVFPAFPNTGVPFIVRQFVQASSGAGAVLPSSGKVVTAGGSTVTYDDATDNIGVFDPTVTVMSSDFENSGYGSLVNFSAGARTSVEVGEHVTAVDSGGGTLFNHSVAGTVTITETAGAPSRIITGSLNVYHNILQLVATSTFNNVQHENNCCYPVSGSVTTTFAASADSSVPPTALGQAFVGQSETLTFTGCGLATFTDYTGASKSVTLTHCL
jgi:hypothetical protein